MMDSMSTMGSTACGQLKQLRPAHHQLNSRFLLSDCRSRNGLMRRGCTTVKAMVRHGDPASDPGWQRSLRLAMCTATASAAAAMLCAHGFTDAPALAESLTITFPSSKIREVSTVQRTLIETWGLIMETYVDPTFNHQGLPKFKIGSDGSLEGVGLLIASDRAGCDLVT